MKKFLGIILCVIMILSAMPITVGAYNGTKYGDYLYYMINDDGSIAITDCDETTKEITIPDTIEGKPVTAIGDRAFSNHHRLTSVVMPHSITYIGTAAFFDCTELKSISLSDIVSSDGKFRLPDSVTYIGNSAFCRCFKLYEINIPSGVTFIGTGVFSSCGHVNITVDSGNQTYCDIEGVLFNKDKTQILDYAKDSIQKEYNIPDGVTIIGESAFSGSRLTAIKIPDSVTSICDYAFDNGTSEFIFFSGSEEQWKSIEIGFENYIIGSAEIYYNIKEEIPSPWSEYTSDEFKYRIFPGGASVMITSYDRTADDVTVPTDVTIPGEIDGLPVIALTDNVSSLGYFSKNTYIPASVEYLGTFYLASENITVDENNKNYASIDGVLFNKGCDTLLKYPYKHGESYIVPNNVKYIASFAFERGDDGTGVRSVMLPSGIIGMEYGAFLNCNIKKIFIPNSLEYIANNVFFNSYNMLNVINIYYQGSKEQWKKINIGMDQSGVLYSAVMHFNAIGMESPIINTVKPLDNTVEITLNKTEYDSKLIAVSNNDDECMASVDMLDVQAGDNVKTANIANNAKTVKIFIWDSLDTMRPLCEPKTITIK